jgi:2-dehydropantoate 2-reductase
MRILVVGAGGIGGYFGGRLLAAGRDVTFLVRAKRAAEMTQFGLVISSPHGDLKMSSPPVVAAEGLAEPFDVILLSCKAYDLDGAMNSFAPAVGPRTAILPLLNGMRHLGLLDARFGAQHILGGVALISTVLEPGGRIVHLSDLHTLSFGERNGGSSERVEEIAAALLGARFDARLSEAIQLEMWEKWVLIATGAGITCLLRGAIGDIVAAGAGHLAMGMLEECCAIAAGQGFPPGDSFRQRGQAAFSSPGSSFTASMFRDIERHAPIEADAIIGDLLERSREEANSHSLLRIALAHLKTYEARRVRGEKASQESS